MKLEERHVAAIVASGLVAPAGQPAPDDLYDLAYDFWVNDSPEVRGWTAEQDKGSYSVVIRGVPGAYFVQAMEYDDDGPFDTEALAEQAVMANFGEFLVHE